MPVQISELVIRATISDPQAERNASVPLTDDAKRIQKILDEMVRKMKSKNER
jgi:hypothetical protein